MQYRMLGNTGMTVSVIGMGTWQLGGEWGKEFTPTEVSAMMEAAREVGINLIDTAECYGDHTSERLIGQAIAHDRDRWIIATKFGHTFHGWMNRSEDYSAGSMVRQLEESLRALRTDHLDLYQVHGVSPQTCQDDTLWEELERQRRAGKITAIGVSIRPDPTLLGRPAVQTAQIVYNRLNRVAEETVLPLCQEKSLGVLARVPLASGLLSGKYHPGQSWGERDVRHERPREEIDRDLREVERIKREELPQGVELAPWALAWCLRHPTVTAVIPGCKSAEQVRANAAAAQLEINQAHHPQAVQLHTRVACLA